MDFLEIRHKITNKGVLEVYPIFKVKKSEDLMVKGKEFYAIWNEETGLWSRNIYDVVNIIDNALYKYADDEIAGIPVVKRNILTMSDFSTNKWSEFLKYIQSQPDTFIVLDKHITFNESKVKKKDYVSSKLPYALNEGPCPNYEELTATLYDKEELDKIEWAIGAIIHGDSRKIQKFLVLHGKSGTGKSTIIDIIQQLFEGYYTAFNAKALGSNNNQFATDVFRNNSLIALQHDGDLSGIEDNTVINSIASHEVMSLNMKHKNSYMSKITSFMFLGTNKPVRITDSKSGIIRRLIDVEPTGKLIPVKRYDVLIQNIKFELGAIASRCLKKYEDMGKHYYRDYIPLKMIQQTDVFYNFLESNFFIFKDLDYVTLKQSYAMYKEYCSESTIKYEMPQYKFKEELKSYFKEFKEIARIDDKQVRSAYIGFDTSKFKHLKVDEPEESEPEEMQEENKIILKQYKNNAFDKKYLNNPAQLASSSGSPKKKWKNINTKLKDIDSSKLHWVKPDINHIVIDFDIKIDGEKNLEKNIEAASKWPPTYTEVSQGGNGIHLHYIYNGDVTLLNNEYDTDIEIKKFTGDAALRRKVNLCNNLEISSISSGLPFKKDKKMINKDVVANERQLRKSIVKALRKEIHPGTKPNMDFIKHILDQAYNQGAKYDVSDMRPDIFAFACASTNQSDYCIKIVDLIKYKSEEASEDVALYEKDDLIFFDVEVYPNLFVIVWKKEGGKKVNMINPSPKEVEEILNFRLVGFNNREYDNHMLYARYIGYNNDQLFDLSQRIINSKGRNAKFAEAYNISYTDIFNFSSAGNKKSLKKWMVELDIEHIELDIPWDQPVPEELWPTVIKYCGNDVDATEAVFNHLKGDYLARVVLAELAGLTPNHSSNQLSTKIIFENEKNPNLIYTDLSKMFPGYEYKFGKSYYRGYEVGEGGWVLSKEGAYVNTLVLDVEAIHPTSAIELNYFGDRTERYKMLKDLRNAIKNKDFDFVRGKFNGILDKYLEDNDLMKALSDALKTVINSVYGMSAASYDNLCKHPDNIDNIIAKRGALFMIDLYEAVTKAGGEIMHVKTDSIKLVNPTEEMIKFVIDFGKKYGYTFKEEAYYNKICLVNKSTYIAYEKDHWSATGTQFKVPYVFKCLFSKEEVTMKDLKEIKTVQKGTIYLKHGEDYTFIGRIGVFYPIKKGLGGGELLCYNNEKYNHVTGTKNYEWLPAKIVEDKKLFKNIDMDYYEELLETAKKTVNKYCPVDIFVDGNIDEVFDNTIPF